VERVLDVSALEPPEPLERIIDALAEMPPGQRLRVLHRREPYALYNMLRQMGYQWRTHGGEGRYEILIWPSNASTEAG
jgi:TusA-related sulfurtransferase